MKQLKHFFFLHSFSTSPLIIVIVIIVFTLHAPLFVLTWSWCTGSNVRPCVAICGFFRLQPWAPYWGNGTLWGVPVSAKLPFP